MQRFKASVEYCGSGFHGMQYQDGFPTVQGVLEDALSRFFDEPIGINFAGRTDAGVHAFGQVIDFVSDKVRTEQQVLWGVNYFLSSSKVRLLSVEKVDIDFDSRLDAKMRHYVYKIINRPTGLVIHAGTHCFVSDTVDFDALVSAGRLLIGTHNFSSFRHSRCDKCPIRTLASFKADLTEQPFGKELCLYFSAKSFLHNMVRKMVGSIVGVGTGRYTLDYIGLLLKADGLVAGAPAFPPNGLYLLRVDY